VVVEVAEPLVVPSWFINPEFVGGTADVPYRRIDGVTGKVEELAPLQDFGGEESH